MSDGKGLVIARDTGLTPTNLAEAMEMAKMLSQSDLAPKDMKDKPGNVLVAIQMGMEVGLKPMQAIQNIAVINGRPTIWGDAMLGLIQASGLLEAFDEHYEGQEGTDGYTAVCKMKRRGNADIFVSRFSIADAKKASLWGKAGPWSNYPKRMLQMRARSFNCRNGFADVLKGLMPREEVDDYDTAAPVEVTIREPQRKSATAAEPTVIPDKSANGNGNGNGKHVISESQRKRFFAIYNKAGLADEAVKGYLAQRYNVHSSKDITTDIYESLCAWAERGGVDAPPAEEAPAEAREAGSEG